MRLKSKKKKSKKKKLLFYSIFLLLLYFSSFFFTIKHYINSSDILNYLLENDSNYLEKEKRKKTFTKIISFIAKIDFDDPLTLVNNNYKKNIKSSSDEEIDIDIIPINNYVKDPKQDEQLDIKNPIVYLYNTHQSEEYASSNNENYNIKPTVMMTSYMLREKLNKNNIPTIVEENDVTEFLRTNNWNYASSYKVTRMLLESAKEKNNSLIYFIDLHRDSVKKSISTINIENKNYAKILFIVGLENSNYQDNLTFTEKLNNIFNEKFPGLSRGIYKKQGKGVNGVYNQDFSPNTILIEVGGSENTIDEVNNTVDAISVVLTEYIKGDNNER